MDLDSQLPTHERSPATRTKCGDSPLFPFGCAQGQNDKHQVGCEHEPTIMQSNFGDATLARGGVIAGADGDLGYALGTLEFDAVE